MNANRIKIFIYFLLTVNFVGAQNNTQSPYSKLGLGDFQPVGYGKSAAMGGAGYSLLSGSEFNALNPAALAGLDSLLSLFEFGLHADYSRISNSQYYDNKWNANLTKISYAMSTGKKWGMAFGLAPYTNVGYKITANQEVNGIPEYYSILYQGSGGLSNLFWSNGFKISRNIFLGTNVSFIFGPKNEDQYYNLTNETEYSIIRKISDQYYGWLFDFSYLQTIPISKNQSINIGLKANAPGKLYRKTTEVVIQNHPSISTDDTLKAEENFKSSINYPVNFGGGISYQYKNRLIVAADYTLDRFSKMDFNDEFSDLIDNNIFAFGVQYKPAIFNRFHSELVYRLGLNYQTGYYQVDQKDLKNIMLTGGLGFNLGSLQFNVFGTYGWRGFTDNNLVRENTATFGLSVAFRDIWFQKRRFQ